MSLRPYVCDVVQCNKTMIRHLYMLPRQAISARARLQVRASRRRTGQPGSSRLKRGALVEH